ncbi:MAG: rod shape-determining protein [Acidobacteria bacterium]|nr:rod shape-determining protein [Acidobacteriota bacterium]
MLRERFKHYVAKMFRRVFAERIAVDLGTVNTLIYTEKRGIVLNEPSTIAVNKYTGQLITVGHEALNMLGREPIDTIVHRPMRDGTIADFDLAEKMLHEFFRRANIGSISKKGKLLHIVTATPSMSTSVERRALKAAVRGAGARWISMIEEGLAAAVGAEAILGNANAHMVVDIGGGTTNIIIASASGIIKSSSIPVAGNELNQAIIELLSRKYRLEIGEQAAESIKMKLATALEPISKEEMGIIGKSVPGHSVKEVFLTSIEVFQAIEKFLQAIINEIRTVLEQTAPNVAVDIYNYGIVLTGGGALVRNLDKRLSQEFTLPVHVAERPLEAVVKGAGKLMAYDNLLEQYKIREETLEWEGANAPSYGVVN